MKKIYLMIVGLLLAFTLTIPSVYAIPVTTEFSFQLSGVTTVAANNAVRVANSNVPLYEALNDFYGDQFEMFPLGSSSFRGQIFNTTIKRNGVQYDAELWKTVNTSTGVESIRLIIWLSSAHNNQIEIVVSNVDRTYALSNPYTVTLNQAQVTYVWGVNDALGLSGISSFVTASFAVSKTSDIDVGDESGINVSSDFSLIPNTIGTLENASDSSKVGYVYFDYASGNLFNTKIVLGSEIYNLGQISLPGVEELNREPISPGIYWTEGGKQYIYYEFYNPASSKPIDEQAIMFIDDVDQVTGFRPFVTINLTDGTTEFVNKLKLYSVVHDGGAGRAFLDVLFPMDIDDLLAIEIEYYFRWQILWGAFGYTEWEHVNVARFKDEVVDMFSTWQHVSPWIAGIIPGTIHSILTWSGLTNGETIVDLVNIDQTYKQNYVNKVNKVASPAVTVNQIFGTSNSIYRVYLDTFNDGRYTNWQIDDDIAIMSLTYMVDGVVYHVGYDDIDNTGVGLQDPGALDDLGTAIDELMANIGAIISFLNQYWLWILIGFVVVIGLIILAPVLNGLAAVGNIVGSVAPTQSYSKGRHSRNYRSRGGGSGGIAALFGIILLVSIILLVAGYFLGWF